MGKGVEVGPHNIQFEDDFIKVWISGFKPHTGEAWVQVEDKHVPSGFYYVTVHFASGNSHRIDYDGANPNRLQEWPVTTMQRNDVLARVEVKKMR